MLIKSDYRMISIYGYRFYLSKLHFFLFVLFSVSLGYIVFFNSYFTKVERKALQPQGLRIKGKNFTFLRKPFRILSGSLHYFRIPRQEWNDRLLKMKAMGLNAVDIYIPWNLHEPSPGIFNFDNDLHLTSFINLVEIYGLYAIIRPGPYICAEWDLGGLPSWLLRDENMKLRSTYLPFMDAVEKYFDKLFAILAPLQFSRGGPVIAFQIENEYGSFGTDTLYMNKLKKIFQDRGLEELLFVCDNADGLGKYGDLDGVLQTINFGTKNVEKHINALESLQPSKPVFVTEFWDGWFDHWGEKHHLVEPQEVEKSLKAILDKAASFNLYMWHGGTNFGFMNGANANDDGSNYKPTITSYDYDAPVSETGDIRAKFIGIKNVIKSHAPREVVAEKLPWYSDDSQGFTAYGDIEFDQYITLSDLLSSKLIDSTSHDDVVSMEMLPINNNAGQSYGYIVYENDVTVNGNELIITNARDFVMIVLNEKILYTGSVKVTNPIEIQLSGHIKAGQSNRLLILVENCGRVNYGRDLNNQRKGILGTVTLDGKKLSKWKIYPLEFQKNWVKNDLTPSTVWRNIKNLKMNYQPSLYFGNMFVHSFPKNTLIELPGWFKGVVFVNGYNLGRYWDVGPQKTLFVTKHWLRMKNNTVILFDLKGKENLIKSKIRSTYEHDIGEKDSVVMTV